MKGSFGQRLIPPFLVAVLVFLTQGPVQGASALALRFQPALAQARPGQIARLEVWVEGAVDLARLEFAASYDATALTAVDADPGRAGVQMEVGPVFSGGYVPQNEAGGGTLLLAAQRFPADGSFSGQGMIAAVTFQVRENAPPGSYPVRFTPASLRLTDAEGQPLTVTSVTDGLVRVPPVTTALSGWITREATSTYARTAVTAVFYPGGSAQPPLAWARACTDAHGDFRLPVPEEGNPLPPGLPLPDGGPPAGPYEWAFVRLDFPNYGSECYWEPLDEAVVHIGWHVLEGGDVNGDGCINIFDIVRIIGHFGQAVPLPCSIPFTPCPPSDPTGQIAPPSDINGDCRVNIFDLTMAAENFGLCSNCP